MRFAIAYLSFHDNVMKIQFAQGRTWKEAFAKKYPDVASNVSDDLEQAMSDAFEMDIAFNVQEIPPQS